MKTKLAKELPLVLIMLAPMVFLLIKWNEIPEQIPMHWNIEGEVDGYGPKYLTPLFNIGLYLLLLIAPKIDPRKRNYDLFAGTYYKLRMLLILFFSTMSVVTLLIGMGAEIRMERFISIAVSILFAIMGNYMSTIRPNFFIGIRTPWTLDNEDVWKRTHLLGGRFWFWGGLACLIASFMLPNEALAVFMVAVLLIVSIIPIVYSYILFRKLKNSHS